MKDVLATFVFLAADLLRRIAYLDRSATSVAHEPPESKIARIKDALSTIEVNLLRWLAKSAIEVLAGVRGTTRVQRPNLEAYLGKLPPEMRDTYLQWLDSAQEELAGSSINNHAVQGLLGRDPVPRVILEKIDRIAVGHFLAAELPIDQRRAEWFDKGDTREGAIHLPNLLEDVVYDLFDIMHAAPWQIQLGYTHKGKPVPDGILGDAYNHRDVLYDAKHSPNEWPFALDRAALRPINEYILARARKRGLAPSAFVVVAGTFRNVYDHNESLQPQAPICRWEAKALLVAAAYRGNMSSGPAFLPIPGDLLFQRLVEYEHVDENRVHTVANDYLAGL